MSDLPPAAVKAAADAMFAALTGVDDCTFLANTASIAEVALEAALPHLPIRYDRHAAASARAAERERIRRLALEYRPLWFNHRRERWDPFLDLLDDDDD